MKGTIVIGHVTLLLGVVAYSAPAGAELNCNAGIEFYDIGGIKRCQLNGNHQLYTARGQRLVCADGHDLFKYPDGKLQRCTLTEALTFDSTQCNAGDTVELDKQGSIQRCQRM